LRTFVTTLTLLACSVGIQAAPVTFGQFLGGGQNYNFSNNGVDPATFSANAQVLFAIDPIVIVPVQLELNNATLTISATTSAAATVNGTQVVQGGLAGTITITRNTPFNGFTNLLTVTFTNGTFSGELGGTSITLNASTPPLNQVTFASDFFNFSPDTTARAFALSFSSVTPALAIGGDGQLASFAASGTGTFSAEPVPTVVPEPGVMSLLGGGLGLIALARFRRRAN
jgi:hypothetical protein